jgi:N-acyl-D-aspartate/D-glutamate deacylase
MHRTLLLALAATALLAGAHPAAAQTYDVVVRNGRVIDPESKLDAVRTVGIRGDRVAYVGTGAIRGRTEIDATGLVVAPGFVDVHRHAHGATSWRYQALDGVTTSLELEIGTADVDAWYAQLAQGHLVNVGVAVGHIPVRMKVMGDSGFFLPTGPGATGTPTEPQREELLRLLETGLRRGAVAVGMGLAYTPAASAMEALQVFRVAGRHGAPVHLHLRGGMSSLIEALGDAAISGAPLHVAHVNSTGGTQVGFYLEAIEQARAHGVDVTTEAYPYTAGATRIESALYADWESWPEERFARMQWAATGERLTRETFRKYRAVGGSVISHSNTEEAVVAALRHPLTMIASDGGRNERDEPTHPRATGTFARILGHYVRESGTLALPAAIEKMTLLPARRLERRVAEMKDRGRLRVGAFADITIFDPARVIDRSTYEKAAVASEGIVHVLVNGVAVVRDGKVVEGVAPGRPIRAPVAP